MVPDAAEPEVGVHRLDAESVRAFHEDGFTGPIPVFGAERLAELRDAVDRIVADPERHRADLYEIEASWSERPEEVVCHFLGGWRCDPALRRAVFDLAATVPCAQVLGVERLRFWHDQVFYKPAHHPGVVPWHQDYSYWQRTRPARHVTLNVMLDDADEDNGCLMFVPGSHRAGLLPSLPFDSGLDAIVEHMDASQRASFRPVAVPVPAGHGTLHHSHTLHGSGPNRSSLQRRALVLNYMCADTVCSASDEPLLRGTAPVPAGLRVEGECFPVVLDLRGCA